MPSPFPGVDPFLEGPEWDDSTRHWLQQRMTKP